MSTNDRLSQQIRDIETSILEIAERYGIANLREEHSYDPKQHMALLHQYEDAIDSPKEERQLAKELVPYNYIVLTYNESGSLPKINADKAKIPFSQHVASALNDLYQAAKAIPLAVAENPKPAAAIIGTMVAAPLLMGAMAPVAGASGMGPMSPMNPVSPLNPINPMYYDDDDELRPEMYDETQEWFESLDSPLYFTNSCDGFNVRDNSYLSEIRPPDEMMENLKRNAYDDFGMEKYGEIDVHPTDFAVWVVCGLDGCGYDAQLVKLDIDDDGRPDILAARTSRGMILPDMDCNWEIIDDGSSNINWTDAVGKSPRGNFGLSGQGLPGLEASAAIIALLAAAGIAARSKKKR
ncbi:MAG: hypothetical protein U9P44_02610 [archaeon]|nr:hypothetical protein [archaeon]